MSADDDRRDPLGPRAIYWTAVSLHMGRVYRLLADLPVEELADLDGDDPRKVELRIAVCDALSWASNYRADVLDRPRKIATGATPERDNVEHLVRGARWARNRLQHGDAHVIAAEVSPTTDEERSFNRRIPFSAPIPFNAPDRTIRFLPVDADELADLGEGHAADEPFYDVCVAGMEVGEVCAWLLNNDAGSDVSDPD